MTPERLHCGEQLPVQMIHGAGPFLITEANWASVIGSLLSRKRLLQKGLRPPVARPARSRWGGGKVEGGRAGRAEEAWGAAAQRGR